MSRVYGMHIVELNPGVSPDEFEEFTTTKFLPALDNLQVPGVAFHLLKADRGEQTGKYLFLILFENTELRDRYFPKSNQPSQELLLLIKPLKPYSQIWDQLSIRQKIDYRQIY